MKIAEVEVGQDYAYERLYGAAQKVTVLAKEKAPKKDRYSSRPGSLVMQARVRLDGAEEEFHVEARYLLHPWTEEVAKRKAQDEREAKHAIDRAAAERIVACLEANGVPVKMKWGGTIEIQTFEAPAFEKFLNELLDTRSALEA